MWTSVALPSRPRLPLPLFAFAAAVLLFAVTPAAACSCPRLSLRRDFAAAKRYVDARVLFKFQTRLRSWAPPQFDTPESVRVFLMSVRRVYKGCFLPRFFVIKARTDIGAACGVDLRVGSTYVLPIGAGNLPLISQCQIIAPFKRLAPKDREFLKSRKPCCGKHCD